MFSLFSVNKSNLGVKNGGNMLKKGDKNVQNVFKKGEKC